VNKEITMSYKTLAIDRTESVITVTINRPARHNALSDEVLRELAELCTKLSARRAAW
jgi:enoyl-CoA hydratase/carnithine racemase